MDTTTSTIRFLGLNSSISRKRLIQMSNREHRSNGLAPPPVSLWPVMPFFILPPTTPLLINWGIA